MGDLGELHREMWGEYRVRRRMLIERIKVTLQSFLWAERLRDSPDAAQAQANIDASISGMSDEPAVGVEDVFLATQGATPAQSPAGRAHLASALHYSLRDQYLPERSPAGLGAIAWGLVANEANSAFDPQV